MTGNRKHLLVDLLQTLVREWGFDEVQKSLANIFPASDDIGEGALIRKRSRPQTSGRDVTRSGRPSARELVSKINDLNDKRDALVTIALKFDQKEFLPTVADMKEFLAMMGEETGALKDRSDGFRRLLNHLTQLPIERLERLASGTSYSGPSRLGPLSDAIKSVGAAIRQHEANSGSDQ